MKQLLKLQTKSQKGFALISTVVVSGLLLLLGLAMHSLSSVAVRGASTGSAQAEAEANARLGLMLAIAELQKTAGPDQRITADGSILGDSVTSPNAVGVWESWSPNLGHDVLNATAPDYDQAKQNGFLRWLVSGDETELSDRNWVNTPNVPDDLNDPNKERLRLFGLDADGFELVGSLVEILDSSDINVGGYAWAVSQEGTKAKINVSGPELVDRDTNDDLQVQPRPNLSLSEFFSQPTDSHDQRAGRVLDLQQAILDTSLVGDNSLAGAHFTTSSNGLLTNVVDGGLKADMSLGFEMGEDDFNNAVWGSDNIRNPFHFEAETDFVTPNAYDGQRPLYAPISDLGVFTHFRDWTKDSDSIQFDFPVKSAPTFNTLRSFYRIPHSLYITNDGVTAFERALDHVAADEAPLNDGVAAIAPPTKNYNRPPHGTVKGQRTQTNIRPVLDRIMFIMSLALDNQNRPTYALTPVITLWNPYNVAIETKGLIAYPWLDLPWRVRVEGTSNGSFESWEDWVSSQIAVTDARQVDPYFIASMTADGAINTGGGDPTPIRFEPGEVRVFCPSSPDLIDFEAGNKQPNTTVLPRARTIPMRPVESVADFNVTGGFVVQPRGTGFVMSANDQARMQVQVSLRDRIPLPYMVSLADTGILDANSWDDNDRGQVVSNIVAQNFNQDNAVSTPDIQSINVRFEDLRDDGPLPIASLEVYHRVASPTNANNPSADLVFSGNPRQSTLNPYVTNTSFRSGSQYDIRMRAISSRDDILQVDAFNSRVRAYYGPSQSASNGRTNLSFFELPQAPLLSLGDLQHADLTYTSYAPANQFANSWASPYVEINEIRDSGPIFDGELDHIYLVNEALWDGFFFSGAAPEIEPNALAFGTSSIWDNSSIALVRTNLEEVITRWVDDQEPLRNSRMKLISSSLAGMTGEEFAQAMIEPEGCTEIASHLMVDGAFNVNSTSVEAWTSILLGLRGTAFDLADGTNVSISDNETPFPRFRNPVGTENDIWQGFRSLSDSDVTELAENIVEEVSERGPFLSLAEFINRRVEDSDLGLTGAIQSAIDKTNINDGAFQTALDLGEFESEDATGHLPNLNLDTGTGIPGYLTQADVLKSIAPIITVRSDTFTIRAYGEAKDTNGNVLATSWVEAVVQRYPDYIDNTNSPSALPQDLTTLNQQFGREFRIISFRYLANNEAVAISQ